MIEMVVEKIIPSELIIHPGETLADILKERGRKENISKGLALGLERVLGVPQSFWCNLQANYLRKLTSMGIESMIQFKGYI